MTMWRNSAKAVLCEPKNCESHGAEKPGSRWCLRRSTGGWSFGQLVREVFVGEDGVKERVEATVEISPGFGHGGWHRLLVSVRPKRNGVIIRFALDKTFAAVPQALSRTLEDAVRNLYATMLSCS